MNSYLIKSLALALMLFGQQSSVFFGAHSTPSATSGGGGGGTCTAVFTDSFPYSNGGLDSVSGGNWSSALPSAIFVSSSVLHSNQSTAYNSYVWSGSGSFTTNQCAAVTFSAFGSNDVMGPSVRASTASGGTFYSAACSSAGCFLVKMVAGSQTNLSTVTGTLSPGDVIKITAVGTSSVVLNLYQNATLLTTRTDSSSTITTGIPGIAAYGNIADTAVTSVSGGND